MSETIVQNRPEVDALAVELQERQAAALDRYTDALTKLEGTMSRLEAICEKTGVDSTNMIASIVKQIEQVSGAYSTETTTVVPEKVPSTTHEKKEQKGFSKWRLKAAAFIGGVALIGGALVFNALDRDSSPEDTAGDQTTEQNDDNDTDQAETETVSTDDETEDNEEVAEAEPWAISYFEENNQRRWMQNGSETIKAQGELGTADEAFNEWIDTVRSDPRAFAFTYNHIFHTDYTEADFIGEDGYVNEFAVEKYTELKDALASAEFGLANPDFYNTGYKNGQFVISENAGISGNREALLLTFEYEVDGEMKEVAINVLGRCIQITVEEKNGDEPEDETDEEPATVRVCVPATGEIIEVPEDEAADYWDLNDLPEGITFDESLGLCVHEEADGPPPVAEQPPHTDTAEPTPGYERGRAEEVVGEQQGDPTNLDETKYGTEAPDGSPGGGEAGVNEEITDETTQDNPDHNPEVTDEYDGSEGGVSNDPESEEADTGEADEDTNTEDELDGGLPGATPGN